MAVMSTSRMPFIMPDGRRLTSLLDRDEQQAPGTGHGSKRKKKNKRPLQHRLEVKFEASNEYDAAELAAAAKLGARRRLRWLNERVLRAMAGPMTAQDMVGLFNPAPFGERKESALQVALADAPQLWDRLRNIDIDKEARVFEKWEGHVRPGGADAAPTISAAAASIQAWQRVGKNCRTALQRMHLDHVHDFEEQLLAFQTQAASQLVVPIESAFERCAFHGLCSYHALQSHSVDIPAGRAVKVRKTAVTGDAAALDGTARPPPVVQSCADARGDMGVAPGDLQASRVGDAAQQGGHVRWPDLNFTVVDILLVLHQSGSNTATLSTELLDRFRDEHLPDDWGLGEGALA